MSILIVVPVFVKLRGEYNRILSHCNIAYTVA
jgi:hypothetical protein